jgi:BA14K-like protein
MSAWKVLMAGSLALATVAAPVSAAPLTSSFAPMAAQAADGSNVVEVRRGYHRGHRHYRRGGNVGLGIGLGIVGGLIAAEAYRSSAPAYDYEGGGDARALCAQNFRSFEWDTGMYTTNSGERRVCPYL